jgi:periplasmic divalent cation tolerance protein
MASHITVLTTTDSPDRAEELARAGVEARVAACAQVDGPIRSVYWWDGALQVDQEWRVLYKLPADRFADLEQIIKATHSYDTPEIIAADITHGSREYLQWIDTETAR